MKLQLLRTLALSLLVAMMSLGLAACEQEGPAEQAGENIDDAMEDAGESVEEMGESVEEAAEESSY